MGVKDSCNESCDYCIWLQEGDDACDCLESVKACNDPVKLMSHHALPLIQRFMDKSSPGGAYLVHGKGGLPESILVGKDEKIILDCNPVFCVKEAQMNALKSGMDGGLSGDHNVSTSLWVSSASQSVDHIANPTQSGRDPGPTRHIVSAIMFVPPFSTPKPGIYCVRGTVEQGEPPSIYLS